MSKRATVILGSFLVLCAAALFGTTFAAIATPCEYAAWQWVLVAIGSLCTLSKGWEYIVKGLDLS